jgi:uncharacterized protein (TIGR04255 family)
MQGVLWRDRFRHGWDAWHLMPFPPSDRLIFEENTLVEVICQLRFPPILSIVSETPAAFQQAIRDTYPLYRLEDPLSQIPANVAGLMSQLPFPQPVAPSTHLFDSEDSKRTISLASDFVAVTERDYTRWELMKAEVERAMAALEEIYAPSFYTRIGLRYQDVVRKGDLGLAEQPWHELLEPAFTGMLGADPIREDVTAIRSDCVVRLAENREEYVKVAHGFVEDSDRQSYAIDMDFFTTERSESADVGDKLDYFNQQAGYLFRWAIRPALRDALRPRPLEP